MPVFFPPVVADVPSVLPETRGPQYELFKYYGPHNRGRTVVRIAGIYDTVDNPTQDLLDLATEVYLGGHVYIVDNDVAAALTAAGYGAFIL